MEDHIKILKKAAVAVRNAAVTNQAAWRQQLDAADPVGVVEQLRKVAEKFEQAPSMRSELALHILGNLTKDDVDRVRQLRNLLSSPSLHHDEGELATRAEMAEAIGDALDVIGPIDTQLAVLQALANPDYEWRTIDGVSRETGLDSDNVSRLVHGLPALVMRSRIPDNKGRNLYATREHYRKTHSTMSRMLDQFRST